jgi:hypothetical protein
MGEMPQVVEINLRLPSFRAPATLTADVRNVNNSEMRFLKRIEIDTIPKPGAVLTMTAGADLTFECTVQQVNWHENKNMFVIACRYGKTRILPQDYDTITNDPEWTATTLL